MRIIRGKYKTRVLIAPKNFTARPTTDFAKEGLFNVIVNYYDLEGLKVLDLFAGTGSISYEFASLGCSKVVSVEKLSSHYNFIAQTCKKFQIEEIVPIRADVFRFIESCKESYDIVFADPPYDLDRLMELPGLIINAGIVAEKGMLIIEHPRRIRFDGFPNFLRHLEYGSVNFSFFEV